MLDKLIDGLKSNPAMLALVAINAALLVFIYIGLRDAAKSREALIDRVFDNSQQIHEVLRQLTISCPGR
jgi:hypothetical protein